MEAKDSAGAGPVPLVSSKDSDQPQALAIQPRRVSLNSELDWHLVGIDGNSDRVNSPAPSSIHMDDDRLMSASPSPVASEAMMSMDTIVTDERLDGLVSPQSERMADGYLGAPLATHACASAAAACLSEAVAAEAAAQEAVAAGGSRPAARLCHQGSRGANQRGSLIDPEAAEAWAVERARVAAAARVSQEGSLDYHVAAGEEEEECDSAAQQMRGAAHGLSPACMLAALQDAGLGAPIFMRKALAHHATSASSSSAYSSQATKPSSSNPHSTQEDMDICSETEEGSGFGWESLWSGLFLDLAGEWAQLRSAAVSAMEGVAAGMHRRQEALAVCVADLQKAVQQRAKSLGLRRPPLWALALSGVAGVALVALAGQVLTNRRLVTALRQRDRELMRLVVKILQLQDALQSAVRPALHANALRSNHLATHMGAMSTML